jgi:hypothetical protein
MAFSKPPTCRETPTNTRKQIKNQEQIGIGFVGGFWHFFGMDFLLKAFCAVFLTNHAEKPAKTRYDKKSREN